MKEFLLYSVSATACVNGMLVGLPASPHPSFEGGATAFGQAFFSYRGALSLFMVAIASLLKTLDKSG